MSIFNIPNHIKNIKNKNGKFAALAPTLVLFILISAVSAVASFIYMFKYDVEIFTPSMMLIKELYGLFFFIAELFLKAVIIFIFTPKELSFKKAFIITLWLSLWTFVYSIPTMVFVFISSTVMSYLQNAITVAICCLTVISINKAYGVGFNIKSVIFMILLTAFSFISLGTAVISLLPWQKFAVEIQYFI